MKKICVTYDRVERVRDEEGMFDVTQIRDKEGIPDVWKIE